MCIRSCSKLDRAPPHFLAEECPTSSSSFLPSLTVPGPAPFIYWISVLSIMEAQHHMWALLQTATCWQFEKQEYFVKKCPLVSVKAGTRGGQEGALGTVKQRMDAGWYTHSTACINSGGRGHNLGSFPGALDNPAPVLGGGEQPESLTWEFSSSGTKQLIYILEPSQRLQYNWSYWIRLTAR